MVRRRTLLSLALIAGINACATSATGSSTAKPPTSASVLRERATEDAAAVRDLQRKGVQVTVGRATVWFPKDRLTAQRMRDIATYYDQAITAIRELVDAPQPWMREPDSYVTYFLAPGEFVPHGGNGRVFMPFSTARPTGTTPIHETAHAILTPRRMWADGASAGRRAVIFRDAPVWLEEGLASYIALLLATNGKLPQVIRPRFANLSADLRCALMAANDVGIRIMAYVGTRGRPPGFDTDRSVVSPPFYACSTAYVQFLVDRFGIQRVAALRNYPDVSAALTKLAGKPAAQLRTEWLAGLPNVQMTR